MAGGIELAKAYVQIVPSAQGMQGNLESIMNDPAKKAGQTAGKSAGSGFASGLKSAMGTIGKVTATALTAASGAIVAFGKSAVSAGQVFDSSMSQVAATMGVTVDEIENLREFAQEMGRITVFSATEAAQALNYMALAGYDAETAMATLPSVLNLAASGSIDLAYASDMITDSQSALGLTLEETMTLVDQMAKAASKSNTSVEQLGEAILTIGGTAQFMSGGTDELATVLGILADNGIKGSEAGTHLRNMLLKLSAPTKDGALAMEELGLSVFDASGQMRPMEEVFQDLSASLEELTDEQQIQALSEIFNTRDVAAAQALLKTTTQRWDELGEAIRDASGAAEAMAGTQLDNLAGDITLFQSALEGAKIAVSDGLTPALRKLVQFGSGGLSQLTEAFKADGFDGAMDVLGGLISTAVESLTTKIPDLVQLGSKLLGGLIDGILAALPTLMAALPEILSAFTGLFFQVVMGLIGALPALVQGLVDALPVVLPQLIEGITSAIVLLLGSLDQIIQPLLMALPDIITILMNGFIENMPVILEALISTLMAIVEQLPNIIQTLVPFVVEGMVALMVAVTGMLDQIIDAFLLPLIEALPDIIIALGEALITNLPVFIQGIIDLVSHIIERLPEILEAIWDAIAVIWGEWVAPALEEVGSFFAGIWQSIVDFFDPIAEWFNVHVIIPVKDFFRGLWDGIVNAWNTIIKPWIDIAVRIWDRLKEGAKAAWEGIKGIWIKVSSWFNEKIIQPVTRFFTGLWDGLKQKAKGAWEGIKNVFKPVADWFKNIFQKAWEGVKNVFSAGGRIFSGIKEGIENVFKTVVNAIIDGINFVIAIPFNAINGFLNTLRNIDILGIRPFGWIGNIGVPQIPRLAQGGVLTGPTLMIGGEDGAEAIVPLERNTEWIQRVAAEINTDSASADILEEISEKMDRLRIYLDSGKLVGGISTKMDGALGNNAGFQQRGVALT